MERSILTVKKREAFLFEQSELKWVIGTYWILRMREQEVRWKRFSYETRSLSISTRQPLLCRSDGCYSATTDLVSFGQAKQKSKRTVRIQLIVFLCSRMNTIVNANYVTSDPRRCSSTFAHNQTQGSGTGIVALHAFFSCLTQISTGVRYILLISNSHHEGLN